MAKSKIYTAFKGTDREFTGIRKEIAEHFNINYDILNSRLQNGYSLEEAIDLGTPKSIEEYTVFKGTDREFTGNKKQIAEHFNINYVTLCRHIKKDCSLEEILDLGIPRSIIKYTVFKGTDREFTGNKKQIAEHFNIKCSTLLGRLRRGHSLEEAINHKSYEIYTVFKGTDHEFTGNKTQIAKHFNIYYGTLNSRIREGFSFEEAIEIPLHKIKENNLTYKDFNGSLKEICEHFDKSYVEVYNKVKYNHTLEWSIESTKTPYKE